MIYALATDNINIATVRDAFAVNQLSFIGNVEYGKTKGDFKSNGKYLFEVGGKSKGFTQISDEKNSFVLADDIETPLGCKLPLWIIGFLY